MAGSNAAAGAAPSEPAGATKDEEDARTLVTMFVREFESDTNTERLARAVPHLCVKPCFGKGTDKTGGGAAARADGTHHSGDQATGRVASTSGVVASGVRNVDGQKGARPQVGTNPRRSDGEIAPAAAAPVEWRRLVVMRERSGRVRFEVVLVAVGPHEAASKHDGNREAQGMMAPLGLWCR